MATLTSEYIGNNQGSWKTKLNTHTHTHTHTHIYIYIYIYEVACHGNI